MSTETLHNPRARTCAEVGVFPVDELRDDIRCPRCDELHVLMHLDPDVREVLTREPWCAYCLAGDKPQLSQAEYDAGRISPSSGRES